MTLSTFEFPFNGLPDQVKPGFTISQDGIHLSDRLGSHRQSNAFGPKFFASHDLFRTYDIDDGWNISYVRKISKGERRWH